MGTKASCSKFKKKTNPPPTPKISEQKHDVLLTQKPEKTHKKAKISKENNQNSKLLQQNLEEIEKSLDFVSFLHLFADATKVKPENFK